MQTESPVAIPLLHWVPSSCIVIKGSFQVLKILKFLKYQGTLALVRSREWAETPEPYKEGRTNE